MVGIRELLEPTQLKITMFFVLIIPCISLILLTFAFLVQDFYYAGYSYSPLFIDFIVIAVLIGLILSYLLGSFLDIFIQSERVKIIIAIFSGIVSILIVYTLFKMITEPVICDPVHTPNQTICDPVHQPSQGDFSADKLMELHVDGSAVKSSFKECIQNIEL
jgi:amino acid permease